MAGTATFSMHRARASSAAWSPRRSRYSRAWAADADCGFNRNVRLGIYSAGRAAVDLMRGARLPDGRLRPGAAARRPGIRGRAMLRLRALAVHDAVRLRTGVGAQLAAGVFSPMVVGLASAGSLTDARPGPARR